MEKQKVRNDRDQIHAEIVQKSGPLNLYSHIADRKLQKKRNLSLQMKKLTKKDIYLTAQKLYWQFHGHDRNIK